MKIEDVERIALIASRAKRLRDRIDWLKRTIRNGFSLNIDVVPKNLLNGEDKGPFLEQREFSCDCENPECQKIISAVHLSLENELRHFERELESLTP